MSSISFLSFGLKIKSHKRQIDLTNRIKMIHLLKNDKRKDFLIPFIVYLVI